MDSALVCIFSTYDGIVFTIRTAIGFLVSYLGTSLVTSHFLRERSYLRQAALSVIFSLFAFLATMWINENHETPKIFPNCIVAFEYLLIAPLVLYFFNLYSEERLSAFSWKSFSQFLIGISLHPQRTFEEVLSHRSTLFSFVSVLLVSVAWIARTGTFSFLADFVPARWHFVPILGIRKSLEILPRLFGNSTHSVVMALVIPTVLFSWVIISVLVHALARQLGGRGSCSDLASLLGFAFLPSMITIAVDLLDFGYYHIGSLLALDVVFFILSFVVPLVLWPLMLVILAVRISEKISTRCAFLVAITVFLPLFVLLTISFL